MSHIPLWFRDMRNIDAIDKYLYLCLLDILGEPRLNKLCLGKDDGKVYLTIDFLIAYSGLEEPSIRKSFYSLNRARLTDTSCDMSNRTIWNIRIQPWDIALGLNTEAEAEVSTPGGCRCDQ
jgi:hypothetical protein